MNTPFKTARQRCLPSVGIALTLLMLLGLSSTAHAQLSFTLDQDTLSGRPGDILTFSGSLANNGTDEIFLNGDDFTLNGDGLTLDDSPFFLNFPSALPGLVGAAGDMFTVTIGPDVPKGVYSGSFTILGGASDTNLNDLASQSFNVAVVPEPGLSALLLSGVAALALVGRRRRQNALRRSSDD